MSTYNVTVENTGNVVTVIDEIINVVVNDEIIRVVTIAEQGPPGETGLISTPNDGELHLMPKAASTGAEGTIFYCGDDKFVYVGVE
jgi:hypothetical protein